MSDLSKTLSDRFKKLDEFDKLLKLNHLIDWEIFRPTLEKVREKPRKSNGGRKPRDVVLMFKMLIIQRLYNLSDEQVEFQERWCIGLNSRRAGLLLYFLSCRSSYRSLSNLFIEYICTTSSFKHLTICISRMHRTAKSIFISSHGVFG